MVCLYDVLKKMAEMRALVIFMTQPYSLLATSQCHHAVPMLCPQGDGQYECKSTRQVSCIAGFCMQVVEQGMLSKGEVIVKLT